MNSSEGISREYVENSSWENETCAFGRNYLKFAAMATKQLIGRALWRRDHGFEVSRSMASKQLKIWALWS